MLSKTKAKDCRTGHCSLDVSKALRDPGSYAQPDYSRPMQPRRGYQFILVYGQISLSLKQSHIHVSESKT